MAWSSPQIFPFIGHIGVPSSSYPPLRICKISWLCSGFCPQNFVHNIFIVMTCDGFLHRFNPTCQKGQKFRRLHRALGELQGSGRQVQMLSPLHPANLPSQLGVVCNMLTHEKRKSSFTLAEQSNSPLSLFFLFTNVRFSRELIL